MARLDLGDEDAGDCLASLVAASLVAEPPYNSAWVNMPLTQVQDPPHRRVEKRAASPLDASDNCKKKPSINKANAEKCHKYRAKQKVKLPRRPRRSYQASLTCTHARLPCAAKGPPGADGRRGPPGHRGESIDLE